MISTEVRAAAARISSGDADLGLSALVTITRSASGNSISAISPIALSRMHNIKADGRDVQLSPLQYFSQQILLIHPLTAPIWIVGVLAFLFWPRLKRYRFLGWAYLVSLTVFVVLKGKNYYLAPIYPMLLGGGSVFMEYVIQKSRQRWLQPVSVLVLLAGGAWLLPLVVPVLPVQQFVR